MRDPRHCFVLRSDDPLAEFPAAMLSRRLAAKTASGLKPPVYL